MNKELYAFWKYDQFPFVLGGQITNMRSDGAVETVGYGKGYWFTPVKILPLEEGRKMAMRLKQLQIQRDVELDVVYAKFLDKRNEIIRL